MFISLYSKIAQLNFKKKLKKESVVLSVYSVLGSLFSNLANILIIGLIIHFLSKEIYGEYSFLYVTITSLGSTVGLATGVVATNLVADWRKRNFYSIIYLFILSILISLVGSIFVAVAIFNDIYSSFDISDLMLSLLTGFLIFMYTVDSFFKSILVGLKKMKLFSISIIIGACVNVTFLLIFIDSIEKLGALISLLISLVFVTTISFYGILKSSKINIKQFFVKKILRLNEDYRKSVFYNLLSSIIFPSVLWVIYYLIKNKGGDINVAEFNLGFQCFIIVTFIPTTANRVLVPLLISKFDIVSKKKMVNNTLIVNSIFSLLAIIFVNFFLQDLIFLFSDKIILNRYIIFFMSLAAFCTNMSAPIGQFIMSQSKFKLGLQLNLISMTILLLLSLYFVNRMLANGGAFAFFLAYLFHLIISITYIYKQK